MAAEVDVRKDLDLKLQLVAINSKISRFFVNTVGISVESNSAVNSDFSHGHHCRLCCMV